MLTDLRIATSLAETAGEAALEILYSNRGGRVLASVTQALYLIGESGELLWLAMPGVPMHRRGVRVSGSLPRPAVGTEYRMMQGMLITDSGTRLDLGSCTIWRTPEARVAQAVALARLPGIVIDTYSNFFEWPKPVGMGNLLPAIIEMAIQAGQPDESRLAKEDLNFLWRPVQGIVQACLRRDFGLLLEHAASLVGLGSGLTPSGDDFLGGLFFAFEMLRRTYPEIRELQSWNYSNFIIESRSRTNQISFCLLKDHAAGYAMEPMHRFARALLEGRSLDQSLPLATELVAVGHSTGWDLLIGLLAGMMILVSY
jgi:hypothetical protein